MTAQIYSTGTVSVTSGSVNFSGSGTAWDLALITGGVMFIEGASFGGWPVGAITSDTAGAFSLPWPGNSLVDANYVIFLETAQAADAIEANQILRDIVYRLHAGTFLQPDATGTLAERDQFDGEAKGFIFIQSDVTPFKVYIKQSATSGDWSDGTDLRGPQGLPGINGVDGIGDFYDVFFLAEGRPGTGEEFRAIVARTVIFGFDFANSVAMASAASTGTAVLSIRKNGSEVGTITFTSSATGVFSSVGVSFAPGDILSIVAPDPQDASLSGILMTLAGTRS